MNIGVVIAFAIYLIAMLAVGVYFFAKTKNLSDYFLGGRTLNPWVAAMSAQASDMSGWLLMGLPGAAYLSGLCSGWIAIGLALGTYLNWKFIAPRLRRISSAADAITIPQYMQNRFKTQNPALRVLCAVVIFVFFLIYTASAFKGGATLFETVFGLQYQWALIIGAFIIIAYTFLGGFLAVSWTDFFQGLLMFAAILIVPIFAGIALQNSGSFAGTPVSGALPAGYGSFVKEGNLVGHISDFAWCLGYFGMPHILVRFMAIRKSSEIKKSRLIAMVWVLLSLTAAVAIGIFGRYFLPEMLGNSETVFIAMAMKMFPGFISGLLMCGVLAATMSTADSQLLVSASALSSDIYSTVIRKKASDKELINVSRITVLVIAIIACAIAWDPNSSIMGLVKYAWGGFGAAFGPAIILSLFWRRLNAAGATAGIATGFLSTIILPNIPAYAATGLYEIIPGFILSMIVIVVVSLLTKAPTAAVTAMFDKAIDPAYEDEEKAAEAN